MNEKNAIVVEGICKSYQLQNTVDGNRPTINALDDISFTIKEGEHVGIVGSNGSGKSTLLRVLAGITKPTSGKAILRGRVAGILEVGAGFHPDMTGRQNVYLNGQLLGFSRKQIQAQMEEIIEFSEITRFIDEPVKNYSSGMYLRLAFAIVACLDFDVYLLDEVMSVGDSDFRKKSQKRIRELVREKGKTILLISHNIWELDDVDRVFYMKDGSLDADSSKSDVLKRYFGSVTIGGNNSQNVLSKPIGGWPRTTCVNEFKVTTHYQSGIRSNRFLNSDSIQVKIQLFGIKKKFNVGVCLRDAEGLSILEISHVLDDKRLLSDVPNQQLTFTFPERYFNVGHFNIDLVFFHEEVLNYQEGAAHFSVTMEPKFRGGPYEHTWGFVKPFLSWEVHPLEES